MGEVDPETQSEKWVSAARAVRNLVSGLYINWILRDLFGRVVPGAIAIWAIVRTSDVSVPISDGLAKVWSNEPAAKMLVIVLSWLMGMAVESIALAFHLGAHRIADVVQPEAPQGQETADDCDARRIAALVGTVLRGFEE